MTLAEKLAKAASLLEQHPHFERAADLQKLGKALDKAVEAFLTKADETAIASHPDYSRIAGLLADPQKKKLATLEWVNTLLKRVGEDPFKANSLTSPLRKKFISILVQKGITNEVVQHLSRTPERILQDEFVEFAKLGESGATKAIDQKYKTTKLPLFCEANGIEVSRKKGKSGREETLRHVSKAVRDFRARQSL